MNLDPGRGVNSNRVTGVIGVTGVKGMTGVTGVEEEEKEKKFLRAHMPIKGST